MEPQPTPRGPAPTEPADAPRRVTKYEQLTDALEQRIGGMQPHDALPTERELVSEFGVSRVTVRRALGTLISRGRVYNVQGSGTYVAHPEVVTKTLHLTGFSEDMRQRGLEPASRVLATGTVHASAETARQLQVQAGTELVSIRRLRLANDVPMALETVLMVADVVSWPGIDLDHSLYEQLEQRGLRVSRAAQAISAVNLDAEQGRALDQAVGAAALKVSRVSHTERGQPFEYAETFYRGDRYSFDIVVSRDLR